MLSLPIDCSHIAWSEPYKKKNIKSQLGNNKTFDSCTQTHVWPVAVVVVVSHSSPLEYDSTRIHVILTRQVCIDNDGTTNIRQKFKMIVVVVVVGLALFSNRILFVSSGLYGMMLSCRLHIDDKRKMSKHDNFVKRFKWIFIGFFFHDWVDVTEM